MNPEYLAHLRAHLLAAQPDLERTHGLEFKTNFGAVAGYVNGRIFAVQGAFGFALKLPPGRCAALLEEKGAAPLRYFPRGHVKKAYVVLPGPVTGLPEQLKALVRESIAFVMQNAA